MKIRLTKNIIQNGSVEFSGTEHDIPDIEALRLIGRGEAEAIEMRAAEPLADVNETQSEDAPTDAPTDTRSRKRSG